ncbi:MAG TPA: hypothetical protein VN903_10320 [Polyangia bacterium]|jgi:hypothetical protein|nr:hypothetical protein [Polyangia bacterium]
MAVYSCGGCGRLISLSFIPGGNPATKPGTKTGAMFARTWRQCRACERLWCDECAAPDAGSGACPDCAGELWTPDAEAKTRLMFPALPRVPKASDAETRTWREDLRLAIEKGLPVLGGVSLRDGLPDLTDGATAQRYLRWVCVLSWVAKADTVLGARISVALDDMYQEVSISMGQVGVAWGGVDPYGPRAMEMSGRWSAPSDADLIALALRCAWEECGGAPQPHVAEELTQLESLERRPAGSKNMES